MNRSLTTWLVLGMWLLASPTAFGDDKDPPRLKPDNLDKLNTANDEDDPHPASSGLGLFYTSTVNGKSEVLFTARRTNKLPWTPGKTVAGLPPKADCRSVFLTADGRFPQHLYFASNKDPEKNNRGDNYDIYFLVKQFPNAEFTSETAVRICTAQDEMHPWLTPDGRQLYYSRKDKDGWRLYVSSRPPGGGPFGKEEALDFPAGFHHATLTSNGKTMFLQGPLEKERWGLFRSTLAGKGWSKPEPLAELNDPEAPTGDRSPCLSRDGALLFFASDRAGGKGGLDLWSTPVAQLGKK